MYLRTSIARKRDGFYDSEYTHGDCINNVRFLAVNFVFHPEETLNRFQAATVTISLHDDTNNYYSDPPKVRAHRLSAHRSLRPRLKPRILRFAPHVLYGGVSPETLDWNFNLTGSLGVSQTPVAASLSPSGGIKSSYKVYQMMRIQGSSRTARPRFLGRPGDELEDGEVVWTMEENPLQKSGLPREMTFVMLITKGDVENVVFDIKIEPKIAAWYGHYPSWWCNLLKHQPLEKEPINLDEDLGQRFRPVVPGRGFNFANLAGSFNDFVSLPGTTYSLTDQGVKDQVSQDHTAAANNENTDTSFAIYSNRRLGKEQKLPSRQNTASTQQVPPPRAQSVPPQQPFNSSTVSQEEPMDYHIYLHNPRSINLHATPPPPSSSAPPQLPPISNLLHVSDPIVRPQTTVPVRTISPANTKTKRRSIDITYKSSAKPPNRSEAGLGIRSTIDEPRRAELRSTSGGSGRSLRRSRSRTDLRSSPLIEDVHSSEDSQTSTPRARSRRPRSQSSPQRDKENVSTHVPTVHSPLSSEALVESDDAIIPMEAPSPPGGASAMLSPPLPSFAQHSVSKSTRERLPFELRRNHSDRDRVERTPRSRDSPSPLRKRREITPSPGQTNENSPESQTDRPATTPVNATASREDEDEDEDDIIDMRTPNDTTPIPIRLTSPRREPNTALASHPPRSSTKSDLAIPGSEPTSPNNSNSISTRRERTALRDISPYAYAQMNGKLLDEDWDEAKGDLKKMRQRKRLSMPVVPTSAYYTYVEPEPEVEVRVAADKDADKDWDER
ncbi:hypothetical protein LTR05_001557 [Lithohypha guttulata]|uniref:Uncharacterized protein n=1 Tax=Lithohypha guttulata TaxID=1690604 RepID=A0AAN7T6N3_9EURO|nr:hypothetical protein LTR05_001557 [Lithohypha guttulata]